MLQGMAGFSESTKQSREKKQCRAEGENHNERERGNKKCRAEGGKHNEGDKERERGRVQRREESTVSAEQREVSAVSTAQGKSTERRKEAVQ